MGDGVGATPTGPALRSCLKGDTRDWDGVVAASASASGGPDARAARLTFGAVFVRIVPRAVGGCGVPSSGSWALALQGLHVFSSDVLPSLTRASPSVSPLVAGSATPPTPGVAPTALTIAPSAAVPLTVPPGLPWRDESLGTVDEFEARRGEELEARMAALSKRDRKNATGETRQFSHRPGVC